MKKLLNELGILNFIRFVWMAIFGVGLLRAQIGKYLIDIYDGNWGQQVNRKKGTLGFAAFHYGLITASKPRRILCVGSQRGFVPAICAISCRDNDFGHVDFVDAGYGDNHPKAWSGDGFWKKVDPTRHFDKLGIGKWITTYVMTTEEFAKKYTTRMYDYIYIDGDHTYSGVKNDYSLFWPKLSNNGYIIFHDIMQKGFFRKKYKFGVSDYFSELTKKSQHIQINRYPGLGIIQKN